MHDDISVSVECNLTRINTRREEYIFKYIYYVSAIAISTSTFTFVCILVSLSVHAVHTEQTDDDGVSYKSRVVTL